MKAYAALHLAEPKTQTSHEVSYEGYKRVEIDFENSFCATPILVKFPIPKFPTEYRASYITVGTTPEGDGELLMIVPLLPHLLIIPGPRFQVGIINNPAELPSDLHPIARAAFEAVAKGEMKGEDLHPAVYEQINNELAAHKLPVIPCVRGAAANIKINLSQMPSLRDLGA